MTAPAASAEATSTPAKSFRTTAMSALDRRCRSPAVLAGLTGSIVGEGRRAGLASVSAWMASVWPVTWPWLRHHPHVQAGVWGQRLSEPRVRHSTKPRAWQPGETAFRN